MRTSVRVAGVAVLCAAWAAGADSISLRGTLIERDGKPVIETREQKRIHLDATDDAVRGVLHDERLAKSDFEVIGHFTAPDRFLVDPVHTRPLFVHKDGKRLYVTYWCELCAIRTYTPGKCWCCQEETDLDLRETEK